MDLQFLSLVNTQWTDHCRQMVTCHMHVNVHMHVSSCMCVDYDSQYIFISRPDIRDDQSFCGINMVSHMVRGQSSEFGLLIEYALLGSLSLLFVYVILIGILA